MDFNLPHAEFQKKVRSFVEEQVLPVIAHFERQSIFTAEIFREMGREGFLGVTIDKKNGGLGLGTLGYCLLAEELGKADAGMIHNGHFQTLKMIQNFGTEYQKDKYLKKLISGEMLAGTAISEPTVGSSFADMQTTYSRDGKYFILNGIKTNINDALEAGVLNVFARDEKSKAVTVFLLDQGTEGFRITRKLDPIGMRTSPLYEFVLNECRLPDTQLLGEEGMALHTFFPTFNFSRLGNAGTMYGIACAAFEETLRYARHRKVGKEHVANFQGIRWMLADAKTNLEAAKMLIYSAATLEDKGRGSALSSSMAKLFSAQAASKVVSDAIEITASYGCSREAPFERYLRDVKSLSIAGGTLEVLKNNIGKQIFINDSQ
jgi:alkylation response protein AidB-like acyl-CoA dehydrogenase